MTTVIDHPRRGHRTIRLALAEADYARLMSDGEFARAQLDQMHSQHPELFPEAWGRGYALCGFTEPSRQQAGLRCRRVRLPADEGVFTVAPAWVMPYLTASVAEVEKAVLLMRFHVPCWALAQVFGRDAMCWYRLEQSLGRFSGVGATVNTDGWAATQGAWKRWFPSITIIRCFLPAFLKIRDRATPALAGGFAPVSQQVWGAYRAPGKAAFAQRLRRLREWAERTLPDSPIRHTLDLCAKRAQFSRSYDPARAHRTSNLVDRLMKFLDRACFNAQYFHGTLASAELRVRALALLWNFCPSSPRTVKKYHGQRCPAERLNGKRYADN